MHAMRLDMMLVGHQTSMSGVEKKSTVLVFINYNMATGRNAVWTTTPYEAGQEGLAAQASHGRCASRNSSKWMNVSESEEV